MDTIEPMDELSPSYLRDGVTFQVRRKGYDPEQVDNILDRVADELERLQSDFALALERARVAEAQIAESAETDQALRRTLLLAQRTADLATSEAQQVAARTLEEAQNRAATVLEEARETARRLALDAQSQLRNDIATLEAARSALSTDVDALGRYLEEERERLRAILSEQLDHLSQFAPARVPPELHEPDVPAPPLGEPVQGEKKPAAPGGGGRAAGNDIDSEGDSPSQHDLGAAEQDESVGAGADIDLREQGPVGPLPATKGPSASPQQSLRVSASGVDPFIAELREAAAAEEPLGPRDESAPGVPVAELQLPGSRWGLRRRR